MVAVTDGPTVVNVNIEYHIEGSDSEISIFVDWTLDKILPASSGQFATQYKFDGDHHMIEIVAQAGNKPVHGLPESTAGTGRSNYRIFAARSPAPARQSSDLAVRPV